VKSVPAAARGVGRAGATRWLASWVVLVRPLHHNPIARGVGLGRGRCGTGAGRGAGMGWAGAARLVAAGAAVVGVAREVVLAPGAVVPVPAGVVDEVEGVAGGCAVSADGVDVVPVGVGAPYVPKASETATGSAQAKGRNRRPRRPRRPRAEAGWPGRLMGGRSYVAPTR